MCVKYNVIIIIYLILAVTPTSKNMDSFILFQKGNFNTTIH